MAWVYCHGILSSAEVSQLLNRLGELGWELVQVLPATEYLELDRRTHYEKIHYFMKRSRSFRVEGPRRASDQYTIGSANMTEEVFQSSS